MDVGGRVARLSSDENGVALASGLAGDPEGGPDRGPGDALATKTPYLGGDGLARELPSRNQLDQSTHGTCGCAGLTRAQSGGCAEFA